MTLHTEMTNGITKQRRMCWDEENRMLLSADEEQMAAYVYDAAGCSLSFSSKRSTHKASGTTVSSTVNGYPSAFGTIGALTLYPSELMTVSNGMYTKHYYNGSARIASRIGGGFVAHNDLNNYNPLTDHVSLLQTPSYDHKADQLRQLWSRSAECAGLDPNLEYAYSLEGSGLYLSLTRIGDGERYFYHSDHLGSSAFITTEMRSIREDLQKTNTPEQNGYATQFLAYMPYGETLDEQQNGTSYYSPFKFSAKEQDLETGYSYFGARYYSPQLSVWLSVDPMSDKAPGWTPYRYGFNNPASFVDPDGRWEIKVEKDANGRNQMVVVGQKGDNLKSLSKQTGLSEKYLKRQLGKETTASLGEGSRITAIGDKFEGINAALNHPEYKRSNCFGTAIGFAINGKVDFNFDNNWPADADDVLLNSFEETNNPQFGTLVRMARSDGHQSTPGLSASQRRQLATRGDAPSGASHFATFLLKNEQGVQVFTKNGYNAPWAISYIHDLKDYGIITGFNGGSGFFNLKRNQ